MNVYDRMVKKLKENSKEVYVCEKCGFRYADKQIAEKCQAWCTEYNSCNLEIIQYALPQKQN